MKINVKGQQLAKAGLELTQVLWGSSGSHGLSLRAVGEFWLRLCISVGILRAFLESWLPNLLSDGHMATEETVPPRTYFCQLSNGTVNCAIHGLSEQMRTYDAA